MNLAVYTSRRFSRRHHSVGSDLDDRPNGPSYVPCLLHPVFRNFSAAGCSALTSDLLNKPWHHRPPRLMSLTRTVQPQKKMVGPSGLILKPVTCLLMIW